jgi:hypothetical protein
MNPGPNPSTDKRGSPTPSYPRILLHAEGATLLAASVAWYFGTEGNWLLFALLLLAPDLAMLGYLRNPRLGAVLCNSFHTYPLPVLLIALSLLAAAPVLLHIALVWLAHIGMDRMFGFGLKYPSGFKDTHLQQV